jgi:hypothetical protein
MKEENMTKITRAYGKEQNFGDILYSKKTKEIFTTINLGFAGSKTITLKRNENGTFDLSTPYYKDSKRIDFKLGKTFPITDKSGNVVAGLTKGTLSLSTTYDKELGKNISVNNNCLYITTHKLSTNKDINSDLVKVGWLTGQFGIEIDSNTTKDTTSTINPPIEDIVDMEEVPF